MFLCKVVGVLGVLDVDSENVDSENVEAENVESKQNLYADGNHDTDGFLLRSFVVFFVVISEQTLMTTHSRSLGRRAPL